MPSMASILAFARNIFDVRMVRMPHCCTAEAMDSRPAVKFRFTGTLPAIITPVFARAPATEEGNSKPIIFSDRRFFRIQPATRRLPVSARP